MLIFWCFDGVNGNIGPSGTVNRDVNTVKYSCCLLHVGLMVIVGLLICQLRSPSAWPYRDEKSCGITIIGWNSHKLTQIPGKGSRSQILMKGMSKNLQPWFKTATISFDLRVLENMSYVLVIFISLVMSYRPGYSQ